jgi:non-homologous end joining protein Ku
MLRRKQAGLPAAKERSEPRPQNVVNLMDALRQSIAQDSKGSAPPATRRKTAPAPAARRTAGKARRAS